MNLLLVAVCLLTVYESLVSSAPSRQEESRGFALTNNSYNSIAYRFRKINPGLAYDDHYYMDQAAAKYTTCHHKPGAYVTFGDIDLEEKGNIGVTVASYEELPSEQAIEKIVDGWVQATTGTEKFMRIKKFGCSVHPSCEKNLTTLACAFVPVEKLDWNGSEVQWTTKPEHEIPIGPKVLDCFTIPTTLNDEGKEENQQPNGTFALYNNLMKFILDKLRIINPSMTYDKVFFMDQASALHSTCPYKDKHYIGKGRVEQDISDDYGVIAEEGKGIKNEYHSIQKAVKEMVNKWFDSYQHIKQFEKAKKFGCSVNPVCPSASGVNSIILSCAFTPIDPSQWKNEF